MHSGNRGNILAANILLLVFTFPLLSPGRVYSAEEETSYDRMLEYSEIIERFDAIEKEIANMPAPRRPELFNEISGSNFEIDLDTNTKVSLLSTEHVTIKLPPEPIGRIEFLLFSTSTRPTTTFTFENLTPGKEYSYYENGFLVKKDTADQNGRISIEQNISESSQISLRSSAHTIYIRSTGEVEPPDAPIMREYVTESYYITADIDDTIVIQRNGITIDGNAHTIYPPSNQSAFTLWGLSAQQPMRNITIKNVNIVGGSYYSGAVYLWLTDNITLENVNIRDVRVGLMASESNQLKVINCEISNAEYGITLSACSSPEIRGTRIDSITNTGIYLYGGSSGSNITGSTITNIASYSGGIYIYNGAHEIAAGIEHSIEGNKFDNCYYSVVLKNANKNRIINNLLGVGQVGIRLDESNNNIISHNTKETAGTAVVLQGENKDNEVSTNTFPSARILLSGGSHAGNTHSSVVNNEVLRINSAGNANIIFENNRLIGGSADFTLSDDHDNLIVGNVMLSGRYDIRRTNNCTFSGNVISGGGSIHVVDNSSGNIFEENTLNNGYGGMFIWETSDNNTIRSNTFEEGRSNSVMCMGEKNEFYRNNFINNKEPVWWGSWKKNIFSKELPIGGNYWEGIEWENPKINWYLLEGEPNSEILRGFLRHITYELGGWQYLGFLGYYKYRYYYVNYYMPGKVFAVEDFLDMIIPTIEADGEIFYDFTATLYTQSDRDYYPRIEPWKIKKMPPGSVSLTAVSNSHDSVALTWVAPGDIYGGKYHLRYSPTLVGGEIASTEIEWYVNTAAGKEEERIIDGLESGTTYYFQLRTRDEVPGNWSDWSPMVSEKTWYFVESADGALGINFRELPPGATDVWINQIEVENATYVMDAANSQDLMLCSNFLYQVEPDGVFDTPAKGAMYYLDPAEDLGVEIDEHSLTVFKFVDPVWQAAEKTSQDTQQNRIEFDCGSTGLFAVFTIKLETAPPVTVIGFDGPQYLQYISTATKIYFTAYDLGADGVPASGVSFTEYRIDGSEWLTYVSSFTLTEGLRAIDYRSRDKLGTYEDIKSTSVYVDGTAPKTTLEFGDGKFEDAGYTYVESVTTLSLLAEDTAIYGLASGTKTTVYRIDEGLWEQYAGSFTMQDKDINRGRHKIEFHSIDNVGNTEEIKTEFVIVPRIHPINIGWPDFPTSMKDLIERADSWDIIEAYGLSPKWEDYPLETIEINKPLNIRGIEGAEIRISQDVLRDAGDFHLIEISSDDVVLSGLTINYGYDVDNDAEAETINGKNLIGIKMDNADNVTIKNNTIMRASTGIYCTNGSNILVENNVFNAYQKEGLFYYAQYGYGSTGISLHSSNNINILSNEIIGHEVYGIHIKDSTGVWLWNNTIRGKGGVIGEFEIDGETIEYRGEMGTGIYLDPDPLSDIRIEENSIVENAIAILVVDLSDVLIANNLIERNSTGIYLSNSSPELRTNTIRFNETGIFTENRSAPAIRENNIYGNSRFGVKNADVSISVNARYNWWQKDLPIWSDTAPADVSSGVDYANWSVIMFGKGFPVAVAGEDINVNAGDMAHFSGAESYDLDGFVYKYLWDFGDGNTFEGKFASHVYQDTGTFLVSLVVEDNEGLKGFDNLNCKVELPDTVPPVTTLNIFGDYIVLSDTQTYVSSRSSFSLTAYDPPFMGRASGLDYTEFKIDSGEWTLYVGTFTLSEYAGDISGEHTIEYRSADKAGNMETAKLRNIYYDVSPPVINILSPVAEEVYLPGGLLEINFSVTDNSDPDPAVAAYLFNTEKSSTIAVVRGQTIEPLDIEAGFWTLTVNATDWLGHSASTTTGDFEVIHDILPPRTVIALSPPKYITETSTFVARETQFSLSAVDDMVEVGDGIGLGVEETRYAVNQETFFVYTSSFTLCDEGENTIRYYSLDVVGNTEVENTLSVIADFSAPETAVSVSAPLWGNYITSRSSITLSAEDKGIIPSGVRETKYSISQSPFVGYDSPLVISGADGIYYLNYYSADNVLNTELIKSATYYLDNTPPATSIEISEPKFAGEDGIYVTSGTVFTLTAEDPVVNEVASGVRETEYRILSSTGVYEDWKIYQPLNITGPDGVYTIEFYSADNVENTEKIKSLTVKVDNTAPETQLLTRGERFESAGKTYIRPDTEIILTAEDPLINEVASGVREIKWRVNDGEWKVYTGSFMLSEGIRAVEYCAYDNLGNTEQRKSQTFYVDGTAPVSAIGAGEPRFEAFGLTIIDPAMPIGLTANDPEVNAVASGVRRIEYRIVSSTVTESPWEVYTGTFTLSEGAHELEYRSLDNVNNTEAVKKAAYTVTYISRYAAYGEDGVKVGGQGEIIGDVRSNGEVKVAGQARIEGSAMGETVELDGTGAQITGEITENTEKINPWVIDLEAIEAVVSEKNDNGRLDLKDGQLRISSNKTVTITSGTYYLSGINVTAKAKLNIEENVNIFCTGKVTVAANAEVNYAGGDYGLVIFCRTDENINISGGGDMRGIIYAPESSAHISGQGLTVGNVFAKRVDVTGQGTIVGTGKAKTGGRSIMSAGMNTAPSNLAVFELKAVYSYPNPAKRVNPKIHFNCGVSDASVNLRIFTVAGEQVFSCDISGSYDSGKNAYEYEWDTAGKASGVYIYLIRADRNGVTLKKTGKMAVIK